MTTHFVVHEPGDSVGVVVVEGIKKGDKLNGWVMDGDSTMEFETLNDIPIWCAGANQLHRFRNPHRPNRG